MVVYTLEQRFSKWACDRLSEDVDFGNKKSSSQRKLILILTDYVSKKNCRVWGLTHTLKSRRTQNESQFSADFDPEA